MTTTATRAPYQVGDHVSALYLDPAHGTSLARAARVLAVQRTDERAEYPWTITYRIDPDLTRDVRVNVAGVDANRYVEPSTSLLDLDERATPAGRTATALAAALRRAGIPGPLATTTGGNNIAVALTWPSGNDRIVIGIETSDDAPTFHVAAYEDREHDAPAHEHTVHTIAAAVTEVGHLLATYRENTTTEHNDAASHDAPWTAPDGLPVTLHRPDGTTTTAHVIALVDGGDDPTRVTHLTTRWPNGLAIVRRTFRSSTSQRTLIHVEPYALDGSRHRRWEYAGATITGHEPLTGITGPLRLHDHEQR